MKKENVKKRMGFDLDFTLIDHKKNRVDFLNSLGYNDISNDIKFSSIKKIVSKDDYKKTQDYIYGEETLLAKPFKNAVETLEFLKDYFDFFLISRRIPKNRPFGVSWVKNNISFFPEKNIYFVDKDNEKAGVAEKLNLNVFIDDKLNLFSNFPENIYKFCFDDIFEHNEDEAGKVKVVRSYKEFLDEIKKLKIFDL